MGREVFICSRIGEFCGRVVTLKFSWDQRAALKTKEKANLRYSKTRASPLRFCSKGYRIYQVTQFLEVFSNAIAGSNNGDAHYVRDLRTLHLNQTNKSEYSFGA